MVTIAQIEAREKELSAVEARARSVISKKVPQRRFGAGVTPEEQQAVIRQKQQAQEVIQQIKSERQNISQVKSQVQANERERQAYELAYSVYLSDKPGAIFRLDQGGSRARKIYADLVRRGQLRDEAESFLTNLKDKGLEPIYGPSGSIIGFEDSELRQSVPIEFVPSQEPQTIDRYQEAGVVELKQQDQQFFTPLPEADVIRGDLRIKGDGVRQPQKGTTVEEQDRFDTSNIFVTPTVFTTEPEIVKGVTGRDIQTSEIIFTQGAASGVIGKLTSPATPEQVKLLFPSTVQQGSPQKFLGETKGKINNLLLEPIGFQSTESGLITGIPKEIITKLAPTTKGELLVDAGLYITGFGVGVATKGVGVSLVVLKTSKVGKLAGKFKFTKIGKGIDKVLPLNLKAATEAGIIAGGSALAYSYGKSVFKQVAYSSDTKETIGILTKEAKTLFLLGAGARKGVESFDLAADFFRYKGQLELPSEAIIAPEFPSQKYPRIKPGQTAGELMKEFYKPIKVLGEEKGTARFFHATPFFSGSEIKVGVSQSELIGLYGAPKLNPSFLKVQQQEFKGFGYSGLLDVSKPTALRLELKFLEFAPGVKPGQANLRPLDKEMKRFFAEPPKAGGAYIPFIKTEKESVAVIGTEGVVTGKPGFITFGGRKVGVIQATTFPSKPAKTDVPETVDFSSYYKPHAKYPVINPTTSSGGYKPYSSPKSSPSYSVNVNTPSYSSIGYSSKISYPKYQSSLHYSPSSSPKPSSASSKISYPKIPSYTPSGPSRPRRPKRPDEPGTPPPPYDHSGTKKRPVLIPLLSSPSKKKKEEETGFRTFIIRGGKKVFLPGVAPRGIALRKGAGRARTTLAATFGIAPTNVRVGKSPSFTPPKSQFRGFKIREGRKVPLQNTFIQRRKKRLSSPREVSQIQFARLR